ncbi:MAG: NfeD family protein [Hyphomonadaceae bacterium]
MDALLAFLTTLGPQHWLVLGLALLIAEMVTGTTYLLWPAVAAFATALAAFLGLHNWIAELVLFAMLVIGLTAFGRPLVQRWRNEGGASGLNERSASLVGTRGVVTVFSNGAGSVQVQDTIWSAVSEDVLEAGQAVIVDGVDGATLKVKRAS